MATKEPNPQEERPAKAPRPPYVKEYMEGKLLLVTTVFIAAFLLLFVRLVYLAIWKNDEYIKNVNNNYGYQTTAVPAPRGEILDRNGDVLANSDANYVLVIEPKAIMEQDYYRITALMVYRNVFGFDADALDARLTEISEACKEKEAADVLGRELSEDRQALYNRRWYWRYPEYENENRTVIDGEVMREVQNLAEQLRSTKRADKIAAVQTLFKVNEEQIEGITADVDAQRAEIKKAKGNILTRIGDLITGAKREEKTIDYEGISKKWSVDELTVRGIANLSVLRIVGIRFETEYERRYPNQTLACKILGFYSPYYPESSMGLERSYDSVLSGVDGLRKTYMTEDLNRDATYIAPKQGNTLVTGIDSHIQGIIEKQIKQFMEEIGAENVGVVCMNPQNGTIVAMADDRVYDPNKHDDLTDFYTQERLDEIWDRVLKEDKSMQKKLIGATPEEQKTLQTSGTLNYVYRNYCLSDTYEPGSAFKPLTVAMGYELGLVQEDTMFVCDGYTSFGSTKIRCHNREGCGELDLTGALANSCNDYLMYVSSLVGRDNFFDYRCRFNIGAKTGVDLPGEVSAENLNFTADQLNPIELATSSFGQGFNTTMMQMAAALCTTINGGYYYAPHVVT
ncbi:MAG: penicillin-binding protein 2, partial [Lachnospiraceae bacterium]|nr:penicillin-binding protein 2 [Lachnospiraceae bacterium]